MGTARSFDFVIVGPSSAGVPLGGRRSEDPGASVLLIEGGPACPRPAISIHPASVRSAPCNLNEKAIVVRTSLDRDSHVFNVIG